MSFGNAILIGIGLEVGRIIAKTVVNILDPETWKKAKARIDAARNEDNSKPKLEIKEGFSAKPVKDRIGFKY